MIYTHADCENVMWAGDLDIESAQLIRAGILPVTDMLFEALQR